MSFRVICIDNSNEKPTHLGRPSLAHLLEEGGIYTVIRVVETCHIGYELFEIKHPRPNCYWSSERFIPLSNIDETELQTEIKQLENV